jgi:pyruvate/2-oxoglutarate dehydrogenase complex dihydrolipoamide dehydrogenase (E3) component
VSPRRPESESTAVIVIGAGAVGVCVARAAASTLGPEGGRVVLIGDARPGGGRRLVADGGVLLECASRGLDWQSTLAHLRTVRVTVEDRNREAALRRDGVDLVIGRARLLGGGRVAIESPAPGAAGRVPEELTARRIVLATGDEALVPDVSGILDTGYLFTAALLDLPALPPSMVVLGGGPTGCEIAQALARFGVNVSVIEAQDRLLPAEHPEVSALVTQALREDGVRVFTGSAAVKVAPTLDGGAWVGTSAGDVAAEGLLLATGRRAAVRGLDLAAAGVTLNQAGWITVDQNLVTSGAGVLAAGHATGLLPHSATDPVMARVAGVNAASKRPRQHWRPGNLPRVVRTLPAFAAVGMDPAQARAVPGARVSDLPLGQLDQSLLSDARPGLVTLVAGPRRAPRGTSLWSGRSSPGSPLLGATIVGPQAGELADLASMALLAGMSVEQLAEAPMSSRAWGAALQHAAAGFAAPTPTPTPTPTPR